MRLPLVGAYNTRPSTANVLTTSSGVVGVGVVGVMVVGQTTQASQKDRRFINCFVHAARDDLSKTATPYVVKRPGFGVANTPEAGSVGSAIRVWVGQGSGNKVITAFGATNSTIYDGTSSLGAITGKATAITETSISGTANLAITSGDGTGWFYPDGGALTEITDAQWPGDITSLAGTFAHLGGYAFIMGVDGNVYNSDLNSISSWTAGNRFATNSYPDKGVGCIRRGDTLVAFGTQSFEILTNAGLQPPGSPLARIPNSTQRIGAVSALAIVNVRDTIFWAGATQQGNVSIFAYDGGAAKVVSNPAIDTQLLLAGPANITLTTLGIYGNTHVIVRAGSVTFAYCIEENNWWELSSLNPIWDRIDGVSIGSTLVNYAISATHTSGKVYVMNPATSLFTDDGFTYIATVQTPASDFGSAKRKIFPRLTVVGDQESATSSIAVNWTDDDFQTWNDDTRTVDLSGDNRRVTRLGSSRKRAFRLVHGSATAMRLQALDLEVVEGAS